MNLARAIRTAAAATLHRSTAAADPHAPSKRKVHDDDTIHPSHRWVDRDDGTAWCKVCGTRPEWPVSSEACLKGASKAAVRGVNLHTESHDVLPKRRRAV